VTEERFSTETQARHLRDEWGNNSDGVDESGLRWRLFQDSQLHSQSVNSTIWQVAWRGSAEAVDEVC